MGVQVSGHMPEIVMMEVCKMHILTAGASCSGLCEKAWFLRHAFHFLWVCWCNYLVNELFPKQQLTGTLWGRTHFVDMPWIIPWTATCKVHGVGLHSVSEICSIYPFCCVWLEVDCPVLPWVSVIGSLIVRTLRPDLQKKYSDMFEDDTITNYIYHLNASPPRYVLCCAVSESDGQCMISHRALGTLSHVFQSTHKHPGTCVLDHSATHGRT